MRSPLSVSKALVEKIRKDRNDNVESMEESKFYMEMGDRIGDWAYYNALDYTIKLLKGEDVSHWELEE